MAIEVFSVFRIFDSDGISIDFKGTGLDFAVSISVQVASISMEGVSIGVEAMSILVEAVSMLAEIALNFGFVFAISGCWVPVSRGPSKKLWRWRFGVECMSRRRNW